MSLPYKKKHKEEKGYGEQNYYSEVLRGGYREKIVSESGGPSLRVSI